jgi:hypothetical protein
MIFASPDGRSEYPLHLFESKSYVGSCRDSEQQYFECKVYDKDGKLLRIEKRPPIDYQSNASNMRSFDQLFTGHVGDEGGKE